LLEQLERKDLDDVPRIHEIRNTLLQYIERRYEDRIDEARVDPVVRFETALAIGALSWVTCPASPSSRVGMFSTVLPQG